MGDALNMFIGLSVVVGIPIGIIWWIIHALSKED